MYQENAAPRGQPRGSYSGLVRPDRRVVGLLGLPGDDPVLDVDLPRAGPGAVDAVGGAHHLVVAPAVPVEGVRAAAALLGQGAQVVGRPSPLVKNRRLPHQRVGRVAPSMPEVSAAVTLVAPVRRAVRRTTVSVSTRVRARGDRQQPQADRVGVGAAVDVAHDQRRHEAAEAAGGADQAGHATDPAPAR